MTDIIDKLVELLRDAITPTTWRVGDHVAKKTATGGGFGLEEETETGYVCTECGAEAPTREELADMTCWEEVGE